jgi:hypothetical protein
MMNGARRSEAAGRHRRSAVLVGETPYYSAFWGPNNPMFDEGGESR